MKFIIIINIILLTSLTSLAQNIETINSGANGDAILKISSDTDNSNEGDNSRIELSQDGGSLGAYIGFNIDWGGSNQPDNMFRIGSRYSGVDNFNRLVINTQNGNIGVGTNNPQSRLDISHTGTMGGKLNIQKSFLRITDGNNSLAIDNNEIYSTESLVFGSSYSHDIRFRNVNTSGRQDLLVIKPNGRVGIGTIDPTHKFSVNGTIRSKEIICEASPWPDYVFTDSYQLKSLSEVENFIATNGHLPNIPSAEEVEKNGIALAEMNAKLLEKIEELTLYIINLEKQQKEEINKLKVENNLK